MHVSRAWVRARYQMKYTSNGYAFSCMHTLVFASKLSNCSFIIFPLKQTSNFELHKYILCEFRILGILRTGCVHCFHVLFHFMEKSFMKILQNLSFLCSMETAYRFKCIYWQFVAKYSVIFKINHLHFFAFYYNIQQCNTAVALVSWYCLNF